jgi:SOS-response transcriptional repressor LexA
MASLPLTEKQERVWRYVKSCERSPSYREICAALGYKSVSRISAIVLTLRKRGYVTYLPGMARTLRAIEPSGELAGFRTSELIFELERRGILIDVPFQGRVS